MRIIMTAANQRRNHFIETTTLSSWFTVEGWDEGFQDYGEKVCL